jgi:hypothetical protein
MKVTPVSELLAAEIREGFLADWPRLPLSIDQVGIRGRAVGHCMRALMSPECQAICIICNVTLHHVADAARYFPLISQL